MNLEDYEILRKNIRRADDNVRRTKAAVENHVSVKLRLLAKKHKPFWLNIRTNWHVWRDFKKILQTPLSREATMILPMASSSENAEGTPMDQMVANPMVKLMVYPKVPTMTILRVQSVATRLQIKAERPPELYMVPVVTIKQWIFINKVPKWLQFSLNAQTSILIEEAKTTLAVISSAAFFVVFFNSRSAVLLHGKCMFSASIWFEPFELQVLRRH
jgi:hypothetical protein